MPFRSRRTLPVESLLSFVDVLVLLIENFARIVYGRTMLG